MNWSDELCTGGRVVYLRSLPARRVTFTEEATGRSFESNVRRNADCPCASGKKFKACCLTGTRTPDPPPPLAPGDDPAVGVLSDCAK